MTEMQALSRRIDLLTAENRAMHATLGVLVDDVDALTRLLNSAMGELSGLHQRVRGLEGARVH